MNIRFLDKSLINYEYGLVVGRARSLMRKDERFMEVYNKEIERRGEPLIIFVNGTHPNHMGFGCVPKYTNTIFIFCDKFENLTEEQRVQVLLHEICHVCQPYELIMASSYGDETYNLLESDAKDRERSWSCREPA